MGDDVLKALANPSNQAILSLLSIEPTYPRRVSELLSLGESDTSRRLTRMEKLGLVESDWEHVGGKNVKIYRLVPDEIHVQISGQGLSVEMAADDEPSQHEVYDRLRVQIPDAEGFVGREDELEQMAGDEPIVIVEGIAGIGKTSLLAAFANRQQDQQPVFYHSFRGTESLTWLAQRLGVFQARHGERQLLDAIEAGAPLPDRRELLLDALGKEGFTVVLDATERIRDEDLQLLLRDAVERVREGKLVLAGRQPPRFDPTVDDVLHLRLTGLAEPAIARLFEERGIEAQPEVVERARERVGGHPLALNLLVEAAAEGSPQVEAILDEIPDHEIEGYLLEEVDEHLSDPERRVLAHASVFRRRFSREDLEAVYPSNPEGAIVKLRRRRLLRDDGDALALHGLLRSFFYDQLEDPGELHERAAEHQLAKGTLEARLEAMDHLLAAGRRQRVLRLLERDLDLEEFDLIEEGYHNLYLELLKELDPTSIPDERQAALVHDELGDIRYHRGEHERALEEYAEARERFAEQDADERVADLDWKAALALDQLDRPGEAAEHVRAGLEFAPEDGRARDRLETLADKLGVTRQAGGAGTAEGTT